MIVSFNCLNHPASSVSRKHSHMKKETHLQLFTKYSGLLLTIFSLLGLVRASTTRVLPGHRTEPSTISVSAQDRDEPIAAIVKAEKANLRDRPSRSGSVLGTVNKGELLDLIDVTPTGPWYRVRDTRSDEGWVHGNTIALLQRTDSTSTNTTSSQQRPRRTLPPVTGRSYINVDGVRVPSPVFSDTRPAGSTARCRDGSYSFSQHRRGTCSYHGGVAEWF